MQKKVSNRMSERIVDVLEAVQVNAVNRNQIVLTASSDLLAHALTEAEPIGQPGDAVLTF